VALFLKSIKLLTKYRNLKPFSFDFKDGLNVIVGENGIGKSTLLNLIAEHKKDLVKLSIKPGTVYQFFDTEKQNPRIKALNEHENSLFEFSIASRFVSHGEAMLPIILTAKTFSDTLLMVDEPESGISLMNQVKIINAFKKIVEESNCQVIITTHSYVIIKNVEYVFNMDVMVEKL